MKANKAIEQLKLRQEQMMREAHEMTRRAELLQAIAECQDPQGGDYRWYVSEIEYTDCLMAVTHLRIACQKTGVSFELKPNHSDKKYGLLMLDNENMSLEDYINDINGKVGEGEEEEGDDEE